MVGRTILAQVIVYLATALQPACFPRPFATFLTVVVALFTAALRYHQSRHNQADTAFQVRRRLRTDEALRSPSRSSLLRSLALPTRVVLAFLCLYVGAICLESFGTLMIKTLRTLCSEFAVIPNLACTRIGIHASAMTTINVF